VVESSVEVVARALSVELARAVGNVGLSSGQVEVESLKELEHLVMIQSVQLVGAPYLAGFAQLCNPWANASVARAGRRKNNASRLFVLAIRSAQRPTIDVCMCVCVCVRDNA
jgi:hypothetical protein